MTVPPYRPTMAGLLLALVASNLMAADPFVYVAGSAPDIACFRLNAAAGTLTPASTSPGGRDPSYLAWSPDRRVVYAINSGANGSRARSFRVDPTSGMLTPLNEVAAGGKGACHIAVHPTGKWVYTAHYGSGHVGVLPVLADGSLGEPLATPLAGTKAHQVVIDRAGHFLFVPCLGVDQVVIYAIDPISGALDPRPPATLPAGAGPRHLAFAPDERRAYVFNELASTLTTFTVDPTTATFSEPQTVSTLPAGFTAKNTGAHVVVTPDGQTIYASNRGLDSLAIFRMEATSGTPTLMSQETAGGEIKRPRDFTVDPTGTIALVANQDADVVTILRINPTTGGLTRLGSVTVGKGSQFVGVMPVP